MKYDACADEEDPERMGCSSAVKVDIRTVGGSMHANGEILSRAYSALVSQPHGALTKGCIKQGYNEPVFSK